MSSSVVSCHDPVLRTRSPIRLRHSASSNGMQPTTAQLLISCIQYKSEETITNSDDEMANGAVCRRKSDGHSSSSNFWHVTIRSFTCQPRFQHVMLRALACHHPFLSLQCSGPSNVSTGSIMSCSVPQPRFR